MRPLELELTAFRSYDTARVDWRPYELVVIAGDTGAGKSTLLDAICFALYGRTPESTRSSEMLTLGAEHGEVRLTFSRDGEVWRATRRFGRRAPEPNRILERLAGDGGPVEETVHGDAMDDRILDLVGLGFSAFTSAVVLAQGRFAQFLQAQPKERDGILRELFGIASLDGARTAAQTAAAAATGRAEALTGQRTRLPAHGAALRGAAARAARAAAARRAALGALAPAAAAVRTAHEAAEAAGERARQMRAAADRLPDRADVDRLAERAATLHRAAADAHSAAHAAREAATTAIGRRDAARTEHGGTGAQLAALRASADRLGAVRARIPELDAAVAAADGARSALTAELAPATALTARLDAHRMVDRAAGELEGLDRALADAGTAMTAAEAAARDATGAREAAEAALQAARRADHASVLRRGLEPGDPCPVCGAAVGVLDHSDPGPAHAEDAAAAAARASAAADARAARAEGELAAARRARDAAAAALDRARMTAAEAGADPTDDRDALAAELARMEAQAPELHRLLGQMEALRRERDAVMREADALGATLGAWLDRDDPARDLGEAVSRLAALEESAEAAQAGASAGRRAAEAAARAVADLERDEVASLRQAAALVAHLIDLPAPAPDAAAAALVDAVARLGRSADAAARDADAAARTAQADADALRGALRERAAPLGLRSIGELDAATQRAAGEVVAARRTLEDIEGAAQQDRLLVAEIAAAHDEAARHTQVAADLRVNRFPRHLLRRYLTRLAAGASTRLHQLSGGAFRFAHTGDDPLDVVDTRRGERIRKASTLSGGERFLASLALALGLADVAAESGGRLECLFLDEGFSALDAESLEQAMEGVERLAGDGRLVGVITHLPGVVERLGAALYVRKHPTTGASEVLQDLRTPG